MINLFYIEILLQVVFQIWFFYPAMYWAVNNIHALVDLIQLGINLHYIPTPPPLRSKWIITTYKNKKYINQVRTWKVNVKIYDSNPDRI